MITYVSQRLFNVVGFEKFIREFLRADYLLLTGLLLLTLFPFVSSAQTIGEQVNPGSISSNTVKIIEPKKDIEVAKSAAIDDEQFELGLYTGLLAVEDFNTNLIYGLSFSYHITPSVLAQINYGNSEVDKATFEENNSFLADDDRDFEYYNLLAGYRLFRGRSFLGRNTKYNSDIYILGGLGSVDFAGDSNISAVIGTSYRIVLTDSLVGNLDFRTHSVDREFLNDNKRTLNTEIVFGLNLLF